jgi:transposase
MKKSNKAKLMKNAGDQRASGETIGIDLGDKVSRYCKLNAEGEVIEEGSFQNTESSIKKHFGSLKPTRIAMETGTQSGWISRLLKSYGHEVLVAHARDLQGISRSGHKNDRNDAEKLGRYARLDPQLLNPIEHRTEQQQADLCAIRARDAVVRARALLVNNARGLAKTEGVRLPPTITQTFGARALEVLTGNMQAALEPLLTQIDQLGKQIATYDAMLEQIARQRYQTETKVLSSVSGVGPLTSLTYVLTLSDAQRFSHSRDVGPYLGLQPRQHQSGARDPQLGISKAGDSYLRKLLVQCANHILGHFGKESRLREWGLSLAGRGGKNAKKRAIVAVARKLAVLLHRLWASQTIYQPFYGKTAALAGAN